MNKERRKRVDAIIDALENLKGDIEEVLEEETEYRDNIPENMQQSERYETADQNCDCLQSAYDSMEEAIEQLEESKT